MTEPEPKKFVILEEVDNELMVVPSKWLVVPIPDKNKKQQYWLPKNTAVHEMVPLYELQPKDENRTDIKWKRRKYENIISHHDNYDEANAAVSALTIKRSFSSSASGKTNSTPASSAQPNVRRNLFSPIAPIVPDNSQPIIIQHLLDIKSNQNVILQRLHQLEENDSILSHKMKGIYDIKKVLYDKLYGGAEYTSSDNASEEGENTPRKKKKTTNSSNGTSKKKMVASPRESPSKKFAPWREQLGLTIDSDTDFELIENKLTNDEEYLSSFRKFLKFVGNKGLNVETKMSSIMWDVFGMEITDYYNTNGFHDKLNISDTKIMLEIKNAIRKQVLTASDKELSKALSKALKSMYNALHRLRKNKKKTKKRIKRLQTRLRPVLLHRHSRRN